MTNLISIEQFINSPKEHLFEILAELSLDQEDISRISDKLRKVHFKDNSLFSDHKLQLDPLDLLTRIATLIISDSQEIKESIPLIFKHLESHYERLGELNQGIYCHLQGYIAWRYDRSHHKALAFLNRSRRTLKACELDAAGHYLARVYDTFGQISYNLGHLQEAIEDFQLAINLRSTSEDHYGRALTYGSLGRVYMDLGNYEAAINFIGKDLEIMANSYPALTGIQIQLLSNLGYCNRENKDLKNAETHYRESLQLAEKSELPISQLFAFIGLGKIEVDRADLTKAVYWKNKANEIFSSHSSDKPYPEINAQLKHLCALISFLQKDLELAREEFREAGELYELSQFTSPTEMAQFFLDYAQVTAALEDRTATATILEAALTQLDATSATAKRQAVETQLKEQYRDQWILHSSRRLTGRDALEKLLEQTGRQGFSVEKTKVVVMFADMRGFTSISEGLDPEELIQLLNAYLTSMIRAVDGQNGYVVQIQGDAILAVFSLPESREDDAERSILASLIMLEQNDRLNDRYHQLYPTINIGIGMHYGEVVTGLIGSPLKRSYTMIGDVVNTSSRIEGLTKILGFPILVSLEVKSGVAANDNYLFMPLGKYVLYGKKEPMSIFALLGVAGEDPHACHLKQWVEMAQDAMAVFERGDFDTALIQFRALAQLTKISAFDYLIGQTLNFIKEPPGAEWDGRIHVLNK